MKLNEMSALALAELIRKKEIKPSEIIESLNSKGNHNAFISYDVDFAFEQARKVEKRLEKGEKLSALAGVPLAVKDNICVKGMRATCGSKMLENFISPYDATVIERAKNAGMIILGKTNMDEFAMGSTGESSYFGAVENPENKELSSGGSSAGSAAAVAANEAIIALGSDTGGSVRLPASYCGAVGFKPTYGALSRYGLISYASSLDTVGIISKTVDDSLALFDVLRGRDLKDSTSIDCPEISPCNNKIGVFGKDFDFSLMKYVSPAYYIIACAEASSNLGRYDGIRFGNSSRSDSFGKEVKKRIMLGNFVLSAGYYEEYYLKAQKARRLIKDKLMKLFEKYDFLVLPVSPYDEIQRGEESAIKLYNGDSYNILANLAGVPALSLGKYQIIGKPLCDRALLSAGEVLYEL